MIYVAGITMSLFVSALLLNKKGKSKSDIFLFVWMLLLALHLHLYYINFTEVLYGFPHLLGIEIPLPLIHGVLLYLYVSSATDQFPTNKWIAVLHLLPVSIGYIYLIPFFKFSAQQKVEFYNNGFEPFKAFMTYGLLLIFLSGIVYVIWSILLLRKHRSNIRKQFSNISKINLEWLQLLIYGLGLVWCIVILTNNDSYIFFGASIFVILIGFFGVQQKTIFSDKNQIKIKSQAQPFFISEEKKKYARSGLNDEQATVIYDSLIHFMTEKKCYKKNDLSLKDLAAQLNIHPNYLSQIINEKEKKSFYDFVNSFRVEEFKRLVKEDKNKQSTLLALAYDSGFNSKSSFNRYFKKKTGKTPSQYSKTILK